MFLVWQSHYFPGRFSELLNKDAACSINNIIISLHKELQGSVPINDKIYLTFISLQEGDPILIKAIQRKMSDVVLAMIDKGADLNVKDQVN